MYILIFFFNFNVFIQEPEKQNAIANAKKEEEDWKEDEKAKQNGKTARQNLHLNEAQRRLTDGPRFWLYTYTNIYILHIPIYTYIFFV